jgi:hypothetical protein
MYALGRTSIGTGDRIGCPGQVNSKYGAAAFTKKTIAKIKLRGAGVVRYWLDNSRPSRTSQSHVSVAG